MRVTISDQARYHLLDKGGSVALDLVFGTG